MEQFGNISHAWENVGDEMTINLYTTTDDRRVLSKTLTELAAVDNVNLLDDCNVISPIFVLSSTDWANANYLYCENFKRYYFIDSVDYINGNLIRLHCSCDVLMSFKNDILATTAIINRGGNNFNVLLADNAILQQANSITVNKAFSGGELLPSISATNNSFVLTCYGGVNIV